MKIDTDVLEVLSTAVCSKNTLVLPAGISRAVYLRVDRVLAALGGKWSRLRRAHLFADDVSAAHLIDAVLLAGEVVDPKRDLGFFESPPDVVDVLIRKAAINHSHRVLEPSAGLGAIAKGILACKPREIVCCELHEPHVMALQSQGFRVHAKNFLVVDPAQIGLFDRVVMNPPFAMHRDVEHVTHALSFLKPGGKLVSVMSAGVVFRQDRVTRDFRTIIHDVCGNVEGLPDDSFASSGTRVRTVVVEIEKRA